MKKFLRENPTIAFGLGLPLALVLVFLLISGVPALFVDPPQYEVLYATEYYGNQNGLQISVVNKKVQVVYQGASQNYQQPRLWRYNPKTGAVKEIPIVLMPGLSPPGPSVTSSEAVSKITPIEVPDVANLVVDSSSIAPDGYEFNAGANGYSGDAFTGIFSSSRYRSEGVLTKNGRSIRLPNNNNDRYYSAGFVRFIGWVVSP